MFLLIFLCLIFQSGAQQTSVGLDRTAVATLLAGVVAFFVAEGAKRGLTVSGNKAFFLAVVVSIVIALVAVALTIDWHSGNIVSNVINAVLGAFGLATVIYRTITAMTSSSTS